MTVQQLLNKRRAEGGYALLTVLVATMIFGLMTLSLLTLVGTDARVQPTYLMSDSMKRSVDGALEAGVAQVKAVPATALSGTIDPCTGFSDTEFAVEGRTVDITCAPSGNAEPTFTPTTGDGGAALSAVGKLPTRSTLREIMMAPNDQGGLGLEAWLADLLLNIAQISDAVSPSLLAVGPNPLTVLGDVNVQEMFLGASPKSATSNTAMNVHGAFRQRLAVEKACNSTWANSNMWGIFLPNQVGNVTSTENSVVCGPSPVVTTPAVTLPDTAALPVVSLAGRACTSGTVHRLQPGRYDASSVDILELWMSGTCPNSVFWFEPGIYRFEAGTTTDFATFTLRDGTSAMVFGTWRAASRWNSGSPFPQCDPSGPGVSIQLGATTILDHVAGHVSMCGDPATNANPRPVLWQNSPFQTDDVRWASRPQAAKFCPRVPDRGSAPNCSVGTATPSLLATSGPAPATFPASTLGSTWQGTENPAQSEKVECAGPWINDGGFWWCRPEYPTWELSNWTDPRPLGQDVKLKSAVLKVRGTSWQIDQSSERWAEVTTADGRQCVTQKSRLSDPGQPATRDIDLLKEGCASVLKSTEDLAGATILFKASLAPQFGERSAMNYFLDHAWLELERVSNTSPHNVTMKRTLGTTYASFTAFGVTYLPKSNFLALWGETPGVALANNLPVAVGHLVANVILSGTTEGTNWQIGTLAARSVAAGSRQVTLQAAVDGRLLASVDVWSNDLGASGAFDPTAEFATLNWAYCNKELTADATCAG